MAARKTNRRKVAEPEPEIEEDEEEEQAAPVKQFATYDPDTHVCVPADTFHVLVQAKHEVDQRALTLIEADAKRTEVQYMGFQANAGIQQEQLARAYEYGNHQRDEAERQRARVTQVEMQMAQMVRQSEDAKLERDRLAADLQRGQASLQRLEMELAAKQQLRQAELDAVKEVSRPVFAVAGQGLMQLLAQIGKNSMSPPGTGLPAASSNGAPPGQAPSAPPGQPGQAAPQQQPPPQPQAPTEQYDLYTENTDEFRAAFAAVFDKLTPRSVACLRALVCSALPGAPAFPDHVKQNLLQWVVEDAGEARVMKLLNESRTAYVVESSPPAVSSTAN